MTGLPENHEEAELRRRFAGFVAGVTAPEALYEKVRSRRRRHRRQAVTAVAAAAVAVAATVSAPAVGLRVLPTSPAHQPSQQEPSHQPAQQRCQQPSRQPSRQSPNHHPGPKRDEPIISATGARGSLGDDKKLVARARAVAMAELVKSCGADPSHPPLGTYVDDGRSWPAIVDPFSVRPYFAEHVGDTDAFAFYAFDPHGRMLFDIVVAGPRGGELGTVSGPRPVILADNIRRDDRLGPRAAQDLYLGEVGITLLEGRALPKPLFMLIAPEGTFYGVRNPSAGPGEPKVKSEKDKDGVRLIEPSDKDVRAWKKARDSGSSTGR